jgi:hypothetical protein
MPIFVIDFNKVPLLPTSEARARLLLKNNKATVYSVVPFTIKLNKKIENPVGSFKIGIDDGAKQVGVSVAYKDMVIFAGNIKLRQDVSKKMLQRSQYRKARRSRNVRHRKARFLNRSQKGWIPPSIKQKKDCIVRVINDLKNRINITECTVEQGQFDSSSLSKGYKLTGKEYQQSEYEGNNWRQKVLWRDGYKCQHCFSQTNLQAHHIIYRSNGGSNSVQNGLTLCSVCHKDLHSGFWFLSKKPKRFTFPAHLQQGKWYLYNELNNVFNDVEICYGWMTAKARVNLGLEKDHHSDASAMIGANNYKCLPYLNIIPKRAKIWENNPTKTCDEKNGFRHWDIVKTHHRRLGVVIGSVRSLKKSCITLRTEFDNNFPVSYNKSKLLWRPSNIIYC